MVSEFVEKTAAAWMPNATLYLPSVRVLTHAGGGQAGMRLIKSRHPSEPEHIRRYRMDNFRSFTKVYFDKVFTTLSKIQNANDFGVTYVEPEKDPLAGKGEGMEVYCTQNYPGYDDVLNWLFNDGLLFLLTEPNGAFAVLPDENDNHGYFKPVAKTFEAARVVYVAKDSALLYDGELTMTVREPDYFVHYRHRNEGPFLYFDENAVYRITFQGNSKNVEELYRHEFGELPVWIAGGKRDPVNPQRRLSLIDAAIDYWDEIVALESDLQGAMKSHVYPEKYVFVQKDCDVCRGSGYQTDDEGHKSKCRQCGGSGLDAGNVYATHLIRPPSGTEDSAIPNPPVGYVTKDLASVQIIVDQIQRLAKQGYSALNMEFISLTPAEQSGIAKSYDRQEMNSAIGKIAAYIVKNVLRPTFWYIALWRYFYGPVKHIPKRLLSEILPSVSIPKSFDILPFDYLAEEIKTQREAGISGAVVNETEREYRQKRFAGNPQALRFYELAAYADPLPNYSLAEKQMIKTTGGCTEEDYVLSLNLTRYIRELERDKPDFWGFLLTDEDRKAMLKEKAKAEVAAIRAERSAFSSITMA